MTSLSQLINSVHVEDAKDFLGKSWEVLKYRKKGWKNWFLNGLSWITMDPEVLGMPYNVGIEPLNICNLECDVCETGAGIMPRQEGVMEYEKYKKLIDGISTYTNTIFLYFMGETFLHPDAYRMVRYASERDIFIDTCTNGDPIKPRKLVESGINRIGFQIGGTTQEKHENYRENSDLEKVLTNLEETLRYRKKLGREDDMTVNLGFIVMDHNTDQISEVRNLAKDLEVDNLKIIDPCVRTVEQANRRMPKDENFWIYDKSEFEKNGRLVPRTDLQNTCTWIWFSTYVQWNGDVVPCCRDSMGQFVMGNAFEESLEDIWNNESYQKFRQKIVTDQGEISMCKYCNGFGFPGLWETDSESAQKESNGQGNDAERDDVAGVLSAS